MAKPVSKKSLQDRLKAALAEVKRLDAIVLQAHAGPPPPPLAVQSVDASSPDLLQVTLPAAFAVVSAEALGGVPQFFLLKMRVENSRIVNVERSAPNLRGVLVSQIEDQLMEDA